MLASPLRAYLVCGRTTRGYGFEGNWSNDRECSWDGSSLWAALAPDQFFESKALERLLSRGITGRQVPEQPPHSNSCWSAFDYSRAVGPARLSSLPSCGPAAAAPN